MSSPAPDDRRLTKDELRRLSQIRPGRIAVELSLCWALIIGLIQVGISVGLWAWLPCILLLGCLQNQLILWTHEGGHCSLHRDRRKNDILGDALVAGPMGITLDSYRWHHGVHHKYLGDPNKEIELSAFFCIRGRQLFVHMARHLFGVVAYTVIFRRQRHSGPKSKIEPPPPRSMPAWIGFLSVNAALFAMCALQGAWYLYFVLWVAPLFTLAIMISNFRTIVEHQPSSDVCDKGMEYPVPPIVRIVDAHRIERYLVAPVGFYYHYEHHLYPGIPYCNLPEVRRILTERGHYDALPMVRSKGFVRTIWALSTKSGYGVPVP